MRLFTTLLGLGTVGLILAAPTHAAVIVNEPFTDGTLVGGTDNSGASWYRRSANNAISVVDESAGIGSGNALKLDVTNTTQIDRPLLGTFASTSLANTGEQLILSFDFRLSATPSPDKTDGFRFGFYNSNGTAVTSDGSSASDNDNGYQATIALGATPAVDLRKETSNNVAGEAGSGSDRVSVLTNTLTTVAINDTLKHTAVFTLTRNGTAMDLAVSVDGTPLATGTSVSSIFSTFDEVLINHALPIDYFIDNVNVQFLVPEPATALLAAAALCLMSRRRR